MNKNNHIKDIIDLNPDISIFRLFEFSFNNKVQDKILNFTDSETGLLNDTVSFKEENKTSFWESFFKIITSKKIIEKRILNLAINHNKNNEYIFTSRKTLIDNIKKSNKKNLALNSKVILNNGKEMHIPMLDFKLKSNSENLNIIQAVLHEFSLKGYILDSGKSYHFIGKKLITEDELINLLAKFILIHPISDKAWAAHQIIERSASLRVSSKYGIEPKLICEI